MSAVRSTAGRRGGRGGPVGTAEAVRTGGLAEGGERRFFTWQGFTLGAVLAGVLTTVVTDGGGSVLRDALERDSDDARAASSPSSPSAESAAPALPSAGLSPGPPSPAPDAAASQMPEPAVPVAPEAVPEAAMVAGDVCAEPVRHLGVDLPVVTQEWVGRPLGEPTTVTFSKKAGGEPDKDVYVVDGACRLDHLFRSEPGARRTIDVRVGQLLLVSGGGGGAGWFPANGDDVDLG